MTTLDLLRRQMQRDLDVATQSHGQWTPVFPHMRCVREQKVGQWCYLAEEFLTVADLVKLKDLLGLDTRQWSAYKWTFLHTAAAY